MPETFISGDGEQSETLQIFGMEIHPSPTGRRVWPRPFKQFIAGKISNSEISVNDAARECGVSRRQIRDWIRSVEGRPVTKVGAGAQKSRTSFAQLTITTGTPCPP